MPNDAMSVNESECTAQIKEKFDDVRSNFRSVINRVKTDNYKEKKEEKNPAAVYDSMKERM